MVHFKSGLPFALNHARRVVGCTAVPFQELTREASSRAVDVIVFAEHLLTAAGAASLLAKHVAKNVAKSLGKTAIGLCPATTQVRVHTGMAMLENIVRRELAGWL